MKQKMGNELPIWKIVNGKTIHKIDNGFIIWGLTDPNSGMLYQRDIQDLMKTIQKDDHEQIVKHLVED